MHDPIRLLAELEQVYRLIAAGVPLTVEQRLKPGNRVGCGRGPWPAWRASCRSGAARRSIVTVTFLQKGAAVEVDDFNLEPLD